MSRNTGRRTRGAARSMQRREEHWPGCEAEHHECALARLREAWNHLIEKEALQSRMDTLLDNIAKAIHGEPGPDESHSWHDLPELVANMKAELARLREQRDAMLAEKAS